MKLLLPVFFAMAGIALAQDAPQATPDKGLNPSKDLDPSDVPALVEKILQTYKQTLLQAKPILDAADIQLPKEVLDAQTALTGQAAEAQAAAGGQSGQGKTLSTGGLKTGSLQTGGLPLTLPNVDPTTEPIEQYQMWRKAERDKAIRDRYLELRQIARTD